MGLSLVTTLTFDGPAPTCPLCHKPLSGAVIWGSSGDVYCEDGHYRGYSYSRPSMGYLRIADDEPRQTFWQWLIGL